MQVHRLLAKNTVDEHTRRVLERKFELFDEYARKSQAKDSDRASTDDGWDQGVGLRRTQDGEGAVGACLICECRGLRFDV